MLSRHLIPFLCIVGISVFALAQDVDDGLNDDVSRSLNAINNALSTLKTDVAELTLTERRVVTAVATGLMSREDAATKLYAVSSAYFEKGQYQEAERLGLLGLDYAPDNTVVEAKLLFRLGNISLATPGQFKDSVKLYDRADEAIQAIPGAEKNQELLSMRVTLLNRRGFVCDCTQQPELAVSYQKRLIDSPELFAIADPQAIQAAFRVVSTTEQKLGHLDEAEKYYTRYESLVKSDERFLDLCIPLLLQRIKTRWPDVNDPQRLSALKELWNESRFRKSPDILLVADEMVWQEYFSKRQSTSEEAIAPQALEVLHGFLKQPGRKELQARITTLDTIYLLFLIATLECREREQRADTVTKLKEELQTAFTDSGPMFRAGSDRNPGQLEVLVLKYRLLTEL